MEAVAAGARGLSRILVVSAGPFTKQIGGGQSYTQDLVTGLAARGHQVTVLEPMESAADAGGSLQVGLWNGIAVWSVRLPMRGETLEQQYTQLSPARIALFGQILRDLAPNVVQINGLMPTMVRACSIVGIRHVVVAHHPGEVCPKGDLLTPTDAICTVVPSPAVCGPCVLRCKKGGMGIGRALAALPMWLHRRIGRHLAGRNPLGYIGRVLYIPWTMEQQLLGLASYLREAQTIVAPSRAMATALIRAGAPTDRVKVISHGIHPLARTPITGLEHRPLRFGFVGRIDHAKGVHVLLRAMQMAGVEGKAELHIHGDATRPKDRAEWAAVLQSLGPAPWLHLHGSFDRDQIERVFEALDVVVLPAICPESFGLVVAEALSAGRPVLATRCGGPEDQIEDGVNGWLVDANDCVALSKRIRQLAANPTIAIAAALNCRVMKEHAQYLFEIIREFAVANPSQHY
jgi:glycosyltransferase involved in cell wall biosynthesis